MTETLIVLLLLYIAAVHCVIGRQIYRVRHA